MSDYIRHNTTDVIIYPYTNLSLLVNVVKGHKVTHNTVHRWPNASSVHITTTITLIGKQSSSIVCHPLNAYVCWRHYWTTLWQFAPPERVLSTVKHIDRNYVRFNSRWFTRILVLKTLWIRIAIVKCSHLLSLDILISFFGICSSNDKSLLALKRFGNTQWIHLC